MQWNMLLTEQRISFKPIPFALRGSHIHYKEIEECVIKNRIPGSKVKVSGLDGDAEGPEFIIPCEDGRSHELIVLETYHVVVFFLIMSY